MWRLWAKALGTKEGKHEKEADMVALVRTAILFSYMLTNACIILNTWRHWNPEPPKALLCPHAQSRIAPQARGIH